LTSRSTALGEVAADAAILVDPLDIDALHRAMLLLFTDPEMRSELSRRGMSRAAGFRWSTAAAETLRVLHAARIANNPTSRLQTAAGLAQGSKDPAHE
jgi:glycosyltransferase involved in cell wall biosynthesis